MEVFFILLLLVLLIVGAVQATIKRKKRAERIKQILQERNKNNLKRIDEGRLILAGVENTVERINEDGVPEFKYRFRANLSFHSPSSALLKHGEEKFIPRPNGNRDAIEEPGGYWVAVSLWDNGEVRMRFEEEPFRYIGGSSVYIVLLVAIREVYEDRSLSPIEKKELIKEICDQNHNVYTVRHVHVPPWESLLVPVFSLAEGFGDHRVSLLRASNIRTIAAARKCTDAEILAIKGIGKVALSSVRNLSSLWPYDENTEVIEKDSEYRRVRGSDCNVH